MSKKRLALEEAKRKSDKRLQIAASDPIAKKVALTDHERNLQKFDRFNEDFVTLYMTERQ